MSSAAFKEYEAYAEKINEINALTDSVNQYRLAVMEARHEEDTWFAEDSLKNLRQWREYHDEVTAPMWKRQPRHKQYTRTRGAEVGLPVP